jgi:hypothetical protein
MRHVIKNAWMLIFSSILLFSVRGYAQNQGGNPERMKEKLKTHKIAFLTERMQLTENEAEKFWPLYRSYEAERRELKEDIFIENLNADISEKEAEKALDNMIDIKTKELDLQKRYISRFRSVIGAKKVIELYKAEKEFKETMVKRIRERPLKRGR